MVQALPAGNLTSNLTITRFLSKKQRLLYYKHIFILSACSTAGFLYRIKALFQLCEGYLIDSDNFVYLCMS